MPKVKKWYLILSYLWGQLIASIQLFAFCHFSLGKWHSCADVRILLNNHLYCKFGGGWEERESEKEWRQWVTCSSYAASLGNKCTQLSWARSAHLTLSSAQVIGLVSVAVWSNWASDGCGRRRPSRKGTYAYYVCFGITLVLQTANGRTVAWFS